LALMRGEVAVAPGGASDGEGRRARRQRRAANLQYEPSLDGLRAAAVLAVLLYHGAAQDHLGALERWTRGGYLGVSAFFTLSGFLITSLLLVERQAVGRISFTGFWSRRARRLLPAAMLLLAAVCLLAPTFATAAQLQQLPGDVWASLAYVLNWHQIITGSNYASIFTGVASPIQHLWSLAIEEQVYLVVPLAVAACLRLGRGRRRVLAMLLAAATVASITWGVVLSHGVYSNRVYLGTDTRLAEITIGALAAILLVGRRAPARPTSVTRAFDVAALGSCAFVLALWTSLDLHSDLLFRGGFAIHAIAITVIIGVVTRPFGLLRGALSWGPLVQLGRRSYGVYLVHWPVMLWFTPRRMHLPGGAAFVVQISLTLAIAMASFRLLERPIRKGTMLTSWRGALAPVVAIASVAVLATLLPPPDPSQIVALADHPRLVVPIASSAHDRVVVLGASKLRVTGATAAAAAVAPPTAPTTTAPLPPLRIMVVGDSFAMSIATGLQRWALTTGKAAVLDASITACGFGRGGRNKGVGFNRTWSPECSARDATLVKDLTRFAPDLVLVAGGMWDVTDRLPPGFSRWTHVGDPAYDSYLTGELQHVADLAASHGARVVWADSPHWNPIPGMIIFTGKGPYVEAQPARADRYNQILTAALTGRPNVSILDLASWMRAQPGGELAPSLRVDGVHFTEASTNNVAAWLGPQLLAAAGRSTQ
jgi:peptidoglycan/LPS O-acetylase OafA/YrhL